MCNFCDNSRFFNNRSCSRNCGNNWNGWNNWNCSNDFGNFTIRTRDCDCNQTFSNFDSCNDNVFTITNNRNGCGCSRGCSRCGYGSCAGSTWNNWNNWRFMPLYVMWPTRGRNCNC